MSKKERVLRATHGDADHPLQIGDAEIPCYVLEDGRRVLVMTGVLNAVGLSLGGSAPSGKDRLSRFLEGSRIKPFVAPDLAARIAAPIQFTIPRGGRAYGYEATILPEICDAVLDARKQGALQKQQAHVAEQAEILVRSFAKVGIIALVDEATGFQYERARKALAEILEKFISDELLKWAKRFPDDFYRELFRLRGWNYVPFSVKRPAYVGKLTNDLIYERLAPGVLEELRRKNPRSPSGSRRHKHHQWLTQDVGHPRLQEHIAAVVALMRISPDWKTFKKHVDKALPRHVEMPLFDQLKKKDGEGK